MKKQIIATDLAPRAVGPYSQAVRAGAFLFVSGQIPLTPITGQLVAGDVRAQARRALENLRGILQSQGVSLQDVVKTTVFLTDINQFAAINEVYAEYFNDAPPARTTVEVSRLPKDALVEIDAIAVMP
jgi:2-iminobutanoate/2-iminopropanoate deaminase